MNDVLLPQIHKILDLKMVEMKEQIKQELLGTIDGLKEPLRRDVGCR